MGATLFSSAGRRGATIGFTAMKENAAFVAPLLVTECSFEKWDVKEAQTLAGVEAAEATSNAQVRYFLKCYNVYVFNTFYVSPSFFWGIAIEVLCSLTDDIWHTYIYKKKMFQHIGFPH